ncbi:MAG: hypothetical protein ICV69_04500 [Thermoleophilaceae bacterium]|nr:hypothetical protein [Thermoleophilaceae bacterium]
MCERGGTVYTLRGGPENALIGLFSDRATALLAAREFLRLAKDATAVLQVHDNRRLAGEVIVALRANRTPRP